MKRDFGDELAKQLRFLATSCAEYDRGNLDEGVRIAAILAVIFHDGRTSQSLLSHLTLRRIQLLSTSALSAHAVIGNLTTLKVNVATGEAEFFPNLNAAPRNLIPFDAWWNSQLIFRRRNQHVCRRHLVLAARDKDGGAHVDAHLDPAYEWLADGAGWKMTQARGGVIIREWTFRSAHLASLRQIGYEVLNSPPLEPYL